MMPTARAFLYFMILSPFSGISQNSTLQLNNGRIFFEKKVNLYANGPVSDDFKRLVGQFRTSYFTLDFDNSRTLYTPSLENLSLPRTGEQQAENNTVYCDMINNIYQSFRSVFGETFVVRDTIQRIKWKITSEKMTIAGFECRRANAIILDSVYVVAFYTNAIPVSSGPELLSGLPGIILGLSLPHLHMNWFATKVMLTKTPVEPQMPVVTQPILTAPQYKAKIQDIYRKWNSGSGISLVQSLL